MNDLSKKCMDLKIKLPLSNNTAILNEPLVANGKTIHNRIAIQPMEGCDGTADGAIGELTQRRYHRFAKSGAGLLWFEAVAIANEGRANPLQLFLNEKTKESFKRLVAEVKEISLKENNFEPILIMQATHSGRYSKPNGKPEPLIAYNKPIFEKEIPIDKSRILSDDYLKSLEEKYAKTAALAQEVGFDGVDIKCCHGYLMSELMSAYKRDGIYGGSFENRTRLFVNSIKNALHSTNNNFIVTSRMNVYDGFEYPYGFGVNENDGLTPDLTEPLKIIDVLHNELKMPLIDITIGNPYANPHVNRPFNKGPYVSPESPLIGVERMFDCVKEIQKHYENLIVIGSGFSYVGKDGAILAAGAVEQGYLKMAGFGRQAFAYPDFAKDIINNGTLDKNKCCIACGKCTELMRSGTVAGCVIRDGETYLEIYNKFC